MENSPLVSVIIPFFNRVDLLRRSLKSVIGQTYQNLEILLVDDGSTEGVEGLLSSIEDDRVRYLRHTANRGVSAARNTGIDAAKGDFVSFLDSDDEWLPKKTERQLTDWFGRSENYQVSYCLSEGVSDVTGKLLGHHDYDKEGDLLHDVLLGHTRIGDVGDCLCIMMNGLLLARKDMQRVGGFDEGLRKHEDWELLIRLAERYRFCCTKDYLVRIHKHEMEHVAHDYRDIPEVRYRIIEKHKSLYQADHEASAIFYAGLAYYEGLCGHKGRGLYNLCKSVAFKPFARSPYIQLYLMMLGRLEEPISLY